MEKLTLNRYFETKKIIEKALSYNFQMYVKIKEMTNSNNKKLAHGNSFAANEIIEQQLRRNNL